MTTRSQFDRAAEPRSPHLASLAGRAALAAASRIRVGHLTAVLPDWSRHEFGDPASDLRAEIRIHDVAALRRLLFGGEVGAGEAYMDGQWSSPDLVDLTMLAALNRRELALSGGAWRLPARIGRLAAHRRNRNTKGGARRNIAAHYDLGNDFYRLWLDETITYSSAVFATPDQSLADAQRNKYRIHAERAGLRPGDHVLEIGTGWGGFALHAAGELGCLVTTVTISPAQHELATRRVREAGLDDRVTVELRDYREVRGTFDAVVSIEMLEAVGAEYYPAFFEVVDRSLRPGGRASIQVISFPDDAYRSQLRGANWIQLYIFPGGVLPSLAALERSLEGTGLLITDVTDIRSSYALTLRAWRTRFLEQLEAVRAMGFDERFIRMWEFYLSISEAGFRTGLTQDLQIVFEKAHLTDARPSRGHSAGQSAPGPDRVDSLGPA
jgi:cyclopropane-fatty-acyl-phospholipid synthase